MTLSRNILAKSIFLIANKMDLEGSEENLAMFRTRFPKVDIIPISADTGQGLDDLRIMLDSEVSQKIQK
jgi:GTP-binding protein